MTEYREILRLYSQGVSQRVIAESLSCSRNTVAKVLQRAKELSIAWPLTPETTDAVLDKLFYPDSVTPTNRRLPDNEYIHKEMAKKGVRLRLLWNEYCEDCKAKPGTSPHVLTVLSLLSAIFTENQSHHAYPQETRRTDRSRLGW